MCDRVVIWVTSIPGEFYNNLNEFLSHLNHATLFSKNFMIFYGKTDDPNANLQEVQEIITGVSDFLSFVNHNRDYELEKSTFQNLLDNFNIMWPRAKFKVIGENRSHFMVGIDL